MAGMRSATAASIASSMRTIPSTMEYSLWSRKWTKAGALMMYNFTRFDDRLLIASQPFAPSHEPNPRADKRARVRGGYGVRNHTAGPAIAARARARGADSAAKTAGTADGQHESCVQRQSPGLSASISTGLRRRMRKHRQRRAQGRNALQERRPVPHRLERRLCAVQEALSARHRATTR